MNRQMDERMVKVTRLNDKANRHREKMQTAHGRSGWNSQPSSSCRR